MVRNITQRYSQSRAIIEHDGFSVQNSRSRAHRIRKIRSWGQVYMQDFMFFIIICLATNLFLKRADRRIS